MARPSALSRLSVRQRLTNTIAVLTTLVLVAVGGTLYVLESRRIERTIDASLAREMNRFRSLQANDPATSAPITSTKKLLATYLERNLAGENEQLFAFPATGSPTFQGQPDARLQGSDEFVAEVNRLKPTGGTADLNISGHHYRIAVQPVIDGNATSAFVVTHDVDEALLLGQRIIVLGEGGRIAQDGTPFDVLTAPADAFVAELIGATSTERELHIESTRGSEVVVDGAGRPLGVLRR